MPYRVTEIGLLVLSKPDEAKKKIVRAFKQNGANRRLTAEALGVSGKTLDRDIESLGIRGEIDSIREKAKKDGWHKDRWPAKEGS